MSTVITKCKKCNSTNIKELNSEITNTSKEIQCDVNCVCNDCSHEFTIKKATQHARKRGILF